MTNDSKKSCIVTYTLYAKEGRDISAVGWSFESPTTPHAYPNVAGDSQHSKSNAKKTPGFTRKY